MKLHELKPAEGSTHKPKRVGRGVGSGWGKTAGRGNKGLKARSGGSVRPGFEGGQMPLHRRLPKRGFTNIFKKVIAVVNVSDLSRFEQGAVVDEASLVRSGLIKGRNDGIKLLGRGDINIALTVKLNAVSRSAKEKIEAAGGTVEVI
jgi:large subunit ribosomal protein L15